MNTIIKWIQRKLGPLIGNNTDDDWKESIWFHSNFVVQKIAIHSLLRAIKIDVWKAMQQGGPAASTPVVTLDGKHCIFLISAIRGDPLC